VVDWLHNNNDLDFGNDLGDTTDVKHIEHISNLIPPNTCDKQEGVELEGFLRADGSRDCSHRPLEGMCGNTTMVALSAPRKTEHTSFNLTPTIAFALPPPRVSDAMKGLRMIDAPSFSNPKAQHIVVPRLSRQILVEADAPPKMKAKETQPTLARKRPNAVKLAQETTCRAISASPAVFAAHSSKRDLDKVGAKVSSPADTKKQKIARYLEKRERRIWKKKKYAARSNVASNRTRVNGRFISTSEFGPDPRRR